MQDDRTSAPAPQAGPPEYTGRYLVLNRDAADDGLPKLLRVRAGLRVATSSDFPKGTVDASSLAGADGVYFENLGIAVTSSPPDQAESLTKSSSDVVVVERERVVRIFTMPPRDIAPAEAPAQWEGLGVRELDTLVCSLTQAERAFVAAALDESARTWGLVSTGVIETLRTGRGIRVAVLDTGFDLTHPDFNGRGVVSKSFIEGETAQDEHSHGTHCIGTSLGPAMPRTMPRYGIATDAEVYAGKVLSNSGSGTDGAVLAGINWAIASGCRVISMSLGTATREGDRHSEVFEAAAQRALAAKCIIIAAAGNESNRRNNIINPVGHPANCPSIMAVGAVDSEMRIADFSTRGTSDAGGKVDIVAPGVDVYSSVPPGTYKKMSGTSMACPHVAGLAALYIEAHPTATPKEIWQLMVRDAKKLTLDAADMGAGLAQAPR